MLEIDGGIIRYARDGVEVWSLPVASLVLVGERTTDQGPGLDDYFFVFVGGAPLSRVIWPAELAGQPLHDYRPAPRAGVLGRLLDRVVPRISWTYTPSVESYLTRVTAPAPPAR
jgi:hypothetical protein